MKKLAIFLAEQKVTKNAPHTEKNMFLDRSQRALDVFFAVLLKEEALRKKVGVLLENIPSEKFGHLWPKRPNVPPIPMG